MWALLVVSVILLFGALAVAQVRDPYKNAS